MESKMYRPDCWCLLIALSLCSNLHAFPTLQELTSDGGTTRVLIIGAGSSGVAAASRLLSNGIDDIIILEAQDYIGGRVKFMESPDNLGVDMGAHWVHGEVNNIVYEITHPLGLLKPSGDFGALPIFVRDDGSVFNASPAVLTFFEELFSHNISKLPQYNSSLDAYIRERLVESKDKMEISDDDLTRLISLSSKSICTLEGCGSGKDVSTKLLVDVHDCEGDQHLVFKKQGYNNIIDIMMKTHEIFDGKDALPVRSKTRLGERVSSIDWSGEKAILTTESGTVFSAEIVLITVSLNVLKSNSIKFIPDLPTDKKEAIKGLGMDVVDKIYLFFDEAWWPQNISGYELLQDTKSNHWSDNVITILTQNSNPTALVAWIVGDAARAMEEDSDKNVIDSCQSLLEKFVGPSQKVPPIKHMIRTKWASNKDVRGSYSYQSIAAENLETPRISLSKPMLNIQGKPIVRWAGEAASHHMFGTVHGAISTGFREADEIIKFLTVANKPLEEAE